MPNFELRKLMECTKEEKMSCLPLIDSIMEIARAARHNGVLALEDRIPEFEDHILKAGVTIIVDGCSREDNKEVMDTLIISSGKTGVALMRQMIIRDGVLAIQDGENPSLIIKRLNAYLGEDIILELGR